MRLERTTSAIAVIFAVCSTFGTVVSAKNANPPASNPGNAIKVQLGPRPYYLVDKMTEGVLKTDLQQCSEGPFKKSDFSIGHRGAGLQFPEHTKASYEAAARMGADILECDVTFTLDGELVCRHAQCDLHTTTNIVAREDLRENCTVPPEFDGDNLLNGPDIKCCTSDITLAQFKTLCGKMDASNPNATTVAEYLGGTANYRTDLYATCGTVLSHKESIQLFGSLGRKFIQRTRPDLLLINEFDFVEGGIAAELFQQHYLSIPQNGAEPIVYPYYFVAPSNTGIDSGFDLNNNGIFNEADDAFGFGFFPGQYGMVLYSKYPILDDDVRTLEEPANPRSRGFLAHQ